MTADTGKLIRELHPAVTILNSTPWPRWTPDSKGIAIPARDPGGRQGIYRIDAESGEAAPIVLSKGTEQVFGPAFSPDGKVLAYLRRVSASESVIVKRDLASGQEQELIRGSVGSPMFSPDGRYLMASKMADASTATMILIPAAGGEAKELMRVSLPERLNPQFWAPDSRSVFIGHESPGNNEPDADFWRVSIDTGERHQVRIDVNMGLQLRVHPDGRRIAYPVAWDQTSIEIWALENFLPASPRKP